MFKFSNPFTKKDHLENDRDSEDRKPRGYVDHATLFIEIKDDEGKTQRIYPWADVPQPSINKPATIKKGF